jgi:hypothetical protein
MVLVGYLRWSIARTEGAERRGHKGRPPETAPRRVNRSQKFPELLPTQKMALRRHHSESSRLEAFEFSSFRFDQRLRKPVTRDKGGVTAVARRIMSLNNSARSQHMLTMLQERHSVCGWTDPFSFSEHTISGLPKHGGRSYSVAASSLFGSDVVSIFQFRPVKSFPKSY